MAENEQVIEPTPELTPAPVEPAPEPTPEPEKTVPLKALEDERRKRQEEQTRRHQIEIEAAELRGRMAATEKKAESVQDGPPTEPTMEQFQDGEGNVDYDAYERAQKRHIVDLAKFELKQETEKARTVETQRQTIAQIEGNWSKQMEGAVAKYPDFTAVVSNPDFRQTNEVAQIIKASQMGADVAYYLATHLDESNKMNTLHPIQVAMEIGRIEAKLAAKPAPEPIKTISAAPEPVTTVHAAAQPVNFDPETASMEDYYTHRQRQTGYLK
jgi:hypothetical protein